MSRQQGWRNPRLLVIAGFVLLWQVLAWWLQSRALPGPLAVVGTLLEQLFNGQLLFHLGVTLLRVIASFVLAMLV